MSQAVDCLPASSSDIESGRSVPWTISTLSAHFHAGIETHPRDELLILEHSLQTPLELDLLLIVAELFFLLFPLLVLVDLERPQ